MEKVLRRLYGIHRTSRSSRRKDGDGPIAFPAERARRFQGAAFSCGLHALVVSALACLALVPQPAAQPVSLQIKFVPSPVADLDSALPSEMIQSASDTSAGSARKAQTTSFEPQSIPLPVLNAEVEFRRIADAAPRWQQFEQPPEGGFTGKRPGKTPGKGDGKGQAGGFGQSAQFFGVENKGDRFVYVIDCSHSMLGPRLLRAKKELLYSINRLGGLQRFYVIFFNHRTYPQFHPVVDDELALADGENTQRIAKWVYKRQAHGSTEPGDALVKALALKPDAVFFLSDGKFSEATVQRIVRLDEKRIPIHTICFESRVGEPLLKRLAAGTGGNYRFVE